MPFTHVSVQELTQMLATDEINIVDIRDQAAFSAGHIPQAEHLTNDNVAQYIASTDKQQALVVCCYHGNSSQDAADFLNQQGFEKTYSLDGGYQAWADFTCDKTLS